MCIPSDRRGQGLREEHLPVIADHKALTEQREPYELLNVLRTKQTELH